mmetsp:Transcript_5980/g.10670  ORF Transcript_5980/g.10670 Transcript_5980/m.10670 type:complete len:241 (+) Transcript_5980:92-814(+)
MSDAQQGEALAPRWLPLESNPELLNSFLKRMGVESNVAFHDVFGLDEELLAMVPQPCVALCLLFPCDNITAPRRAEWKEKAMLEPENKDVFYLKQLDQFGNACGTIACVHAVANAPGVSFTKESALHDFIIKNKGLEAEKIGFNLANEPSVQEASDQSASDETAQTETPDRDDIVNHHFVSFTYKDGRLIELDGRMEGPLDHGPSSAETFLSDAAKVIREQFMALDPENVGFNVTALCVE